MSLRKTHHLIYIKLQICVYSLRILYTHIAHHATKEEITSFLIKVRQQDKTRSPAMTTTSESKK